MNNNMLAFPTPFAVIIQYDDGSCMRVNVFAMRDLGYKTEFFIYSTTIYLWLIPLHPVRNYPSCCLSC